MKDVKVSVVIPVYNSEAHLAQCLESVCGQSLKEIEIICVDDGSTDSSSEILERFRQRDPRIQILHQKNQYAGVARNRGREQAKGEYLVFWDSDDFFKTDALEKMYRKCEEDHADICVCGAYQYFEQGEFVSPSSSYLRMKWVPDQIPFNRKTNPDYIMNFTGPAAWNKMFRRSFVEQSGLYFQAVRNGNDVFFGECTLCRAERITVINERLVYYRKDQKTSLLGTIEKAPLTALQAWGDVREYLIQNDIFPEKSYLNAAVANIRHLMGHISASFPALQEALGYLKKEGLSRLGICEPLDGLFYSEENERFARSLLKDSMEQFLASFMAVTYVRLSLANAEKRKIAVSLREKDRQLEKQKKEYSKKLRELENSSAYRVGKVIVWLPQKIASLFKNNGK